MAKKTLVKPELSSHMYWYIFPGDDSPTRIKEGELPTPPYKRFESQGEAMGHLMVEVGGYCCASKNVREEACPMRFSCQKHTNFHNLADTGKFRGIYMGDLFKWAPFYIGKEKQILCNSFEEKSPSL